MLSHNMHLLILSCFKMLASKYFEASQNQEVHVMKRHQIGLPASHTLSILTVSSVTEFTNLLNPDVMFVI